MNAGWEIVCYLLIFLAGISAGSLVNILCRHFMKRSGSTCPHTTRSSLTNFAKVSRSLSLQREKLKTVDWKELLTELVSGIGALLLFSKFGLGLEFFALTVFCSILLLVFRIDMQAMIIPDAITLSGTMVGFIFSLLNYDPFMDWKSSLIGIMVGIGLLYVPAYIFRLLKGTDGIGGGDIKLIGMVGSFIGAQGVLFTILIASLGGYFFGLTGVICQRISSRAVIPFGPFISLAAAFYVFWGKTTIQNVLGVLYL